MLNFGLVQSLWSWANPSYFERLLAQANCRRIVAIPSLYKTGNKDLDLFALDAQALAWSELGASVDATQGFLYDSGVSLCLAQIGSVEAENAFQQGIEGARAVGAKILSIGAPGSRSKTCIDDCGSSGLISFVSHYSSICRKYGFDLTVENLPPGNHKLGDASQLSKSLTEVTEPLFMTLDLGNLSANHVSYSDAFAQSIEVLGRGNVKHLQWNMLGDERDLWCTKFAGDLRSVPHAPAILFLEGMNSSETALLMAQIIAA
jgi:hypothetical protein